MNADWKWFLNAGMNSNKLQRNIIGASSNFVIINDKGDVSNNLMSTQTVTKTTMLSSVSTAILKPAQ